MSYFKLEDNNFKVFIKNSHLSGQEKVTMPNIINIEVKKPVPKSVKTIIKNLELLTKDDKIIWFKNFESFYRGIVIKECGFSDYRIFVEDNLMSLDDFALEKLIDFEPMSRISLIKDDATQKTEYVISIAPDNYEILNLLETIEKKIIQENN